MTRPLDEAFEDLDRPFDQGASKIIEFDFDSRPSQTSRALARMKMDLIQAIDSEQRALVRSVVSESVLTGEPPATTARKIRDAVGLTPNQASHVANFRRELESLDRKALRRALRDKRYDRTLATAMSDGKPLTGEQIDAMVGAYKRKYIALRGMTIARTESLRAANLGQIEAVRDGIDSGEIDADTVVKRWIATSDSRTRDHHRELNGKTVTGIDTPFVLSNGVSIRHPHDPDAPAAETINCRCTLAIEVNPPRF